MPRQQGKKSGGARKYGRNLDKCKRYRDMHQREINKIRRILRSNGLDFARVWARENNVMSVLNKLIAKRQTS